MFDASCPVCGKMKCDHTWEEMRQARLDKEAERAVRSERKRLYQELGWDEEFKENSR